MDYLTWLLPCLLTTQALRIKVLRLHPRDMWLYLLLRLLLLESSCTGTDYYMTCTLLTVCVLLLPGKARMKGGMGHSSGLAEGGTSDLAVLPVQALLHYYVVVTKQSVSKFS
jgi:hypothetical protein